MDGFTWSVVWTAGEIVAAPAPDGVKLRDLLLGDGEDLGRLLWSGFGSECHEGGPPAGGTLRRVICEERAPEEASCSCCTLVWI